jgi:hypothetical protein
MTIEVLTTLLAKGQTGNEILDILDAIADGGNADDCSQNAPTLEQIDF